MAIASWVAGHSEVDPVVMDPVADTEPIRDHRGKATEVHSRTGEGAGGEDVVVDGGVRWVCVQAVQSLALWIGQGKQVTVKTLAWWEKKSGQYSRPEPMCGCFETSFAWNHSFVHSFTEPLNL